MPAGPVDLTQPSPVATELMRVAVPLPVVLDGQAKLGQREIGARDELVSQHDPILGHDWHATDMQVNTQPRFRWRLSPRVAAPQRGRRDPATPVSLPGRGVR